MTDRTFRRLLALTFVIYAAAIALGLLALALA